MRLACQKKRYRRFEHLRSKYRRKGLTLLVSKKPKTKKPKPRIPLPQKPPKVEPSDKVYRRREKHPAQEDIAEEDGDDSGIPKNDSA